MKLSGEYACVSFSGKHEKFLKRIIVVQVPSEEMAEKVSYALSGVVTNAKKFVNIEEDLISFISENYGRTEHFVFLVQSQQEANKIFRALGVFKSLLKVFTHSSMSLGVKAPLTVENFTTLEELREKIAFVLASEVIIGVQERR